MQALRTPNWDAWCGIEAAWFANFFVAEYLSHLGNYTSTTTRGIMAGSDGTTHQLIGLAKSTGALVNSITGTEEARTAVVNMYLAALAARANLFDKVVLPKPVIFKPFEVEGSSKRKAKETEESKAAPKAKKAKAAPVNKVANA